MIPAMRVSLNLVMKVVPAMMGCSVTELTLVVVVLVGTQETHVLSDRNVLTPVMRQPTTVLIWLDRLVLMRAFPAPMMSAMVQGFAPISPTILPVETTIFVLTTCVIQVI